MSDSSPPPPRSTRRTRIVCVSDTHNSTVKLPKGDVLIHSGDLTNQGSYSELSKAVQWLEKADFDAKIVIAGNHDITLDPNFYAKHGSSFHNKNPQDPAKCLSLLTASPTITYLQHRSATIRLSRPDGPGTEFTVFGSPYSPEYGTWAFMYPRPDQGSAAVGSPNAAELWAAIPPDTDILVTHTPAYSHCDDSLGCRDLRAALARVRPRLHVCGHVHQARGAERVRWDTNGLGAGDGVPAEASVERWEDPSPDPASAKISLVDLTARGGKRALDFQDPSPPRGAEAGSGTSYLPDPAERVLSDRKDGSRLVGPAYRNGGPGSPSELGAQPESTGLLNPVDRSGRRETCVINCAIAATSWPHVGGRRFHKPIVVDLDLPVWR